MISLTGVARAATGAGSRLGRAYRVGALMMTLVWMVGCAAPEGPTQLDVSAGQYDATFNAARRVLRDARFNLERVDASQGVITTRPKHSAGLLTPWDSEQSTAGQELEETVHNQRRVVRVTFEPATAVVDAPVIATGDSNTPASDGGHTDPAIIAATTTDSNGFTVDLRDAVLPLRMNVRVIVFRDYQPGWQVQTSSVRLSSYTFDPALSQRGMLPDFETAIDEDRALAAWLTREISERAGELSTADGE